MAVAVVSNIEWMWRPVECGANAPGRSKVFLPVHMLLATSCSMAKTRYVFPSLEVYSIFRLSRIYQRILTPRAG